MEVTVSILSFSYVVNPLSEQIAVMPQTRKSGFVIFKDFSKIRVAASSYDMQSNWMDDAAYFAKLIETHKGNIVIYTGAGISTSACIPDYRGTNGLWTNQLKQHEASENSVGSKPKTSFDSIRLKLRLPEASVAVPTFTHMAIKTLVDKGYVRHVVSQNVDGLHLRSGLKRENLSELHGNLFMEQCIACKNVVFRAFDVAETTGRSQHFTGRICPKCCKLKPVESRMAGKILQDVAMQLINSKHIANGSRADVMTCYRHAARKLAKSYDLLQAKTDKCTVMSESLDTKYVVPLLRDVVVHFFEKQPEMGLAEIYRVQSAIEAIHGRKSIQKAMVGKTAKKRGRCNKNDDINSSDWIKRVRLSVKESCKPEADDTSQNGDSDSGLPKEIDPDCPAGLIIIIGSSLTVLRNYSFLWPYGLGRCVKKSKPINPKKDLSKSVVCKLVIINLQPTCKDGIADLVFRVPCDTIFRSLMSSYLHIDVPNYDPKRDDPLFQHSVSLEPHEEVTRTRPDIPFLDF